MNHDLRRQLWVTASAILCVCGTLLGIGVIGRRVEESSGGSLAADATLLAPGTPAFSIWSVIYVGLFAYTVWQWLPRSKSDPRARAVGWLAGASMLLNAAWLLVTQVGLIWLSVGVIAALVAVLGLLVRRLTELPATRLADTIVLDGTFGAYLGWVCVATCANIAAAGTASGWSAGLLADQFLAVVVLAVAAALSVALARQLRSRWALAGAMAWGLGWIAIARLTDDPRSLIVGVGALIAVAVVLASPIVGRLITPVVRPARAHA